MAQDVLFYVLSSHTPEARMQFLAKLLNKVWSERRNCDVRFADLSEAQRFDLQLWDYRPSSFIPHAVAQEMPAPIQLYGAQITQSCGDVLVNLHPELASNIMSYQRNIEILDQSEYLIEMGRIRWKQYKKQGLEPTVHKL